MPIQETSCSYRGKTFVGAFQVFGSGPQAMVSVRYNGEELNAKRCGLPIERVARTLLHELVVLEALSITVKAAEKRVQAAPMARAMHGQRAA